MDNQEHHGKQNFLQSKTFKWILIGIGALIVLLLVFRLGILVGFKKAGFYQRWGENYSRNFGGPRGGIRDFLDRDFMGGHGVSGEIVKIDGQVLVIKSRDNSEKLVNVIDSTSIRQGRKTLKLSDLKPGDHLVIIGTPKDDGSIDAKLIRVFDANSFPSRPFSLRPRNFNLRDKN